MARLLTTRLARRCLQAASLERRRPATDVGAGAGARALWTSASIVYGSSSSRAASTSASASSSSSSSSLEPYPSSPSSSATPATVPHKRKLRTPSRTQSFPFELVPIPSPSSRFNDNDNDNNSSAVDLAHHAAYPSSNTMEQLAIIEICLATGNLTRAKRIFAALRSTYDNDRLKSIAQAVEYGTVHPSQRPVMLRDVVPVSIHTSFLRAMLRQALVHASSGTVGARTRRRAFTSEAWEWFEMLLREESVHGRIDDSAFAVMLKGLVALDLTNPVTRVVDAAAPHLQPISRVYTLLKIHQRSLDNVMRDPIFLHAGLAGLNDHPAAEVLDALASVLGENEQTDALAEVEEVRHRVNERMFRQSTQDAASMELGPQAASTASPDGGFAVDTGDQQGNGSEVQQKPVTIPVDPLAGVERLQPAKRRPEEAVPYKLGSLLGNLDTITGQRLHTKDPYVRQDLLEESAYDAARWQAMHDADQLQKIGRDTEVKLKGKPLQHLMSEWLAALEPLLEERLQTGKKRGRERSGHPAKRGGAVEDDDVRALLRLMDVKKIAFVTIVESLRTIGASMSVEGIKATRAIIHLGRAIEDEFGAEAWKELKPDLFAQTMQRALAQHRPQNQVVRSFMIKQGVEAGAAKFAASEGYGDEVPDEIMAIEDPVVKAAKIEARQRAMPWTQRMRAKVGGFLIKAFMDVATVERVGKDENGEDIFETQPAVYQSYQFLRGQKIGVLKLNTAITSRLDKDSIGTTIFPRCLPMLVPPKPWTSWNSGGYRIHATDIMRISESAEQRSYLKAAAEHGQLDEVYAALDVLGNTAWTVNRDIFDVITEVWNSGEALAEIPVDHAESKIPEPTLPENVDTKDPRIREAMRIQLKHTRNSRSKAHSVRCDLNYKLEIARAFLGETFYFPHNIDFRGRAYPIPPNLSHIGNDMSRGLLQFAEGRELGARGLTWLHIQIANSFGYDKASFEDRERWTKEHLDEIRDSAEKPLQGNRWWLKADDPWQCLAACKELINALSTPDPEKFLSRLPIQQDGTCNGLQHYAALGGDQTGAMQVNLTKGDKPADVYTAIANLVNERIQEDLKGSDDNRREIAKMLEGKVTRKVVKQTVMTTVYGVTFVGAKRQIERQLRDRGDIPLAHQFHCAAYLADIVLSSIGNVFKGASAIQLWLSVCARLIGKAAKPYGEPEGASVSSSSIWKEPMASIVWTTPLGIPVVQPYRKVVKHQIDTALQSVFISDPNTPTPVDPRAQATAFPPNYVHSLDATHMMLTAIECQKENVVFASVHDSYWTHAGDADKLGAILRECFLELHSRDLLGDLKREFEARYEGFFVRKDGLTETALAMTAHARAQVAARARTGRDGGESQSAGQEQEQEEFSVPDFAKGLGGAASSLPPLTVARERDLLAQAEKDVKKRHKSGGDAALEAAEDKIFEIDSTESAREDDDDEGFDEQEDEDDDQDESEHALGKSRGKGKGKSPVRVDVPVHHGGRTGRFGFEYYELKDILPDIPPRGDFDLELVKQSPYFFS